MNVAVYEHGCYGHFFRRMYLSLCPFLLNRLSVVCYYYSGAGFVGYYSDAGFAGYYFGKTASLDSENMLVDEVLEDLVQGIE